jgi:hypothetical protein
MLRRVPEQYDLHQHAHDAFAARKRCGLILFNCNSCRAGLRLLVDRASRAADWACEASLSTFSALTAQTRLAGRSFRTALASISPIAFGSLRALDALGTYCGPGSS